MKSFPLLLGTFLGLSAVGQPAAAQSMPMPMPMPMPVPVPPQGNTSPTSPANHSAHNHGVMDMGGALGPYPMEREASGTAWQPDGSEHMGVMTMSGDWTLMAHGVVNLVYDHQSGPRGADKAFASGMLMGMARRPLGNGTLQFRAMVSPDPLMGPSGYPLLLASGETANGRDRLIDRQHPHDFFMELSASASQTVGPKSSLFVYAGLPGEPAFGPPAFMHREAISDSPEAPISHHWLDSTHISFGVVTAGLVLDSREAGSQPLQWTRAGPASLEHRDRPAGLDGGSRIVESDARARPARRAGASSRTPNNLSPGVDQKRLSASALYAREIAPGWKFAGTLAWGRKTVEHHK